MILMFSEYNYLDSWIESGSLSEGRSRPGCSFSFEHGLVIAGGSSPGSPCIGGEEEDPEDCDQTQYHASVDITIGSFRI